MISLLVVNYRSAALAADAIRTARRAASEPLQIVVVDNSCDEREAESLRPLSDVLLISGANRGYAGAINDGRMRCDGDVIVISNADVKYAAGCIDRLHETLEGRTAVAGPALYWDDGSSWILPPSDLHRGSEVLDKALASRSATWRASRDRRRIRKRLDFWSLHSPTPVQAISGAVMAVRADVFDEIGGFDERFPLYFEETDFVRRVQQLRRRVVYVPAARCRHLYNQSAGEAQPYASASWAVSEQRYLAKWNGPFAARLLKSFERPLPPVQAVRIDGPIALKSDRLLVEASPLASFDTAAGHFPQAPTIDVPAEVWAAYRTRELYLRLIDRDSGDVLARYVRYKT